VKQVEVSGRGAYYCPRRQGKEANGSSHRE
jgi:hypothetical protein